MSATSTKKVSPYPFVMNDSYISLVVEGARYVLNQGHPTFDELSDALRNSKWNKVPKLVTLAAKVANQSHGAVTVTKDGVFYKGRKIDSSLTRKITTMLKENLDISFMLKFMDNLYKNPSESAISELFDFLNTAQMPITDDGCFMAYKAVTADYKDVHSRTFDYTVGQVAVMKRTDVNPNRHETCSRGLHFCSLGYLGSFGGQKIMAVKINPADVVSIPSDYNYCKGRTWKFEVIKELSEKTHEAETKDHPYMTATVIPIAKERKALLAEILGHRTVKRYISRGKVKETSLRKWSYGQLARFWNKLPHPLAPAEQSKLFQNTLRVVREQAGIKLGEIAEELDLGYKAVWAAERAPSLRQSTIDRYLDAVKEIQARRVREKNTNEVAAAV
jgi:hypothetical protein